MAKQLFINGFGRIGRSMLRAWLQDPGRWPDIEIIGINDVMTAEMAAYLFRFDSVFGPYPGAVSHRDFSLQIDDMIIPYSQRESHPARVLGGVDFFAECTGRATTRAKAAEALTSGAKRVLVSGPCPDADLTVVLGANDHLLDEASYEDATVISNASCTTNAVAPLLRLLDDAYGVQSGMMSTVHCYTGSQPSVDKPTAEMIRSRAAALSIVPTTTSAEKLADVVLPHLAGRVIGSAVRVPVASVSAVDLSVATDAAPEVDAVNALFEQAAVDHSGIFGAERLPVVSTDLRQRPESIILSLLETKRNRAGMLRVFGWYDNEWGFSNRMLDLAQRLA